MSASTVGTVLDRNEWLERRRQGIGSSDAAAICGLDPFRSPLAVWLDKTGQLPEQEPTERMRWGTRLESAVAAEFTERNEHLEVSLVEDVKEAPLGIVAHPDRPWMLASPDRLVFDDKSWDGVHVPLEIKTAHQYAPRSWGDDGIPERFVIQLHHQMAVLDAPYGWLAVLIGGSEYRQERVDRDDTLIESLYTIEERFWQRVVDREQPPADGHAATAAALDLLYPAETAGKHVVLPDEARELVARYRQALADAAAAEKAKSAAAAGLKALLGDAEAGFLDGEKTVTWKTVGRKEFTVPASESRRFTVAKERAA